MGGAEVPGEAAAPDPAGSDGRNRATRALFAGLPQRYDQLVELLTFGQNARWRRAMIEAALAGGAAAPGRVLDVASGTAGVAVEIARRSRARVVGVDLSSEMLEAGRANVALAGEPGERVRLALARAERLPFPDAAFDAATFTYLLRYVSDVDATLAELARVLKPGAPVASLDFGLPERQPYRAVWSAYVRLVLPVAGLLTGGVPWWRVGRFLGPNISGFYARHSPSQLETSWRAAGFVEVHRRPMTFGGGLVMWGRRGGGA